MTPPIGFDAVPATEFPALYTAYKENRAEIAKLLSSTLVQPFEAMMNAGAGLDRILAVSLPKAHIVDPLLDRSWTALSRNLSTWEHSFVESEAFPLTAEELELMALARQVRQTLIGDDLAFLQLPYPDQWRESSHRLKRLNHTLAQGLTVEQAIEKFRLTPLLQRVQRLHEAYGKALGITSNTEWDKLSEAWDAAFNHFMFGFLYQHKEINETNKKLQELLVAPYQKALEREQSRQRANRAEQQKRAAAAAEAEAAAAKQPATSNPQPEVPQNGEQPKAPQGATVTAESVN